MAETIVRPRRESDMERMSNERFEGLKNTNWGKELFNKPIFTDLERELWAELKALRADLVAANHRFDVVSEMATETLQENTRRRNDVL